MNNHRLLVVMTTLSLLGACATTGVYAPGHTGAPVLAAVPSAWTAAGPFEVRAYVRPGPRVQVGQPLTFDIVSLQAGYLSAYAFSNDGTVAALVENGAIEAGALRTIPRPGDGAALRAGSPAGRSHLVAIVSTQPLPGAGGPGQVAVLSSGHEAFARALQERLDLLDRSAWSSTVATVDVAG